MPSTFTQANRTFAVTTPLGADAFGVAGFTVREGVSQPYEAVLDLYAPSGTAVAFDQLLGQSVTLDVVLPDGSKRHFNGIARSVAQRGTEHVGDVARTHYRMVVVPKLWLLTRQARSRIFQQKTVQQILEAVLAGVDTSLELQGTYEPREYCVQYRETDFDFMSRLMEEEGIFYFFTHDDGAHTMVIGDTPISHPDLPTGASITFDPGVGGLVPDDRISEWEKVQELTSGKITLWDHSFELPGRNLEATADVAQSVQAGTVSHKLRVTANQALELYDYPGGYAKRFDGVNTSGGDAASNLQKISQDNTRTANIRAVQVAAGALQGRGASNCRQLVSGHKFTLAAHPDADGAYVLTAVEHEGHAGDVARAGGDAGFSYTNRFACIPAALPFRPARVTPRPRVDGCQTAEVVGPAGEQIFTDKYGRVKVQFHWDREGQKNASSSCWVRVATALAGAQYGGIHIPRIGQEVVVDFLEGDPDRPIIVGSVYNANQMPPYTLPDNKSQSGFKFAGVGQGGSAVVNELRFEDKAGEEQVYFQAAKDEVWNVEHDRTTTVKNDDTRTVTEGNDVVTVSKGNRDVTVSEGNLTTKVDKGDETHTVGTGKLTLTVESDLSTTVNTGNRSAVVKTGNDETSVDTGNMTTTVKTGNYETTVNLGNITIKASAGKIAMEAVQEITLKVGPNTLKISPSGIELTSTSMIKLGAIASTVEMSAAAIQVNSPVFKVQASGALQMRAGGAAGLAGGGAVVIEGGGATMVNGGVVMIN